jgi:siroheme synthase-like protein
MFVRVDRLRCVVVGGGAVAARKARGLIDAGATVTVVSPELHPDLTALLDSPAVRWIRREAHVDDLAGANLVFLATSDGAVNARLELTARSHGALVNRADAPDDGTFHVPAVLRRGDITVAVSTGGRAPGIAQLIRDDIESIMTEGRVSLLDVIAEARDAVHDAGMRTDSETWHDLPDDQRLLAYIEAGQRDRALGYAIGRLKSERVAQ